MDCSNEGWLKLTQINKMAIVKTALYIKRLNLDQQSRLKVKASVSVSLTTALKTKPQQYQHQTTLEPIIIN